MNIPFRFISIIEKLRKVANKYGYTIYAVGGFVRDLLLGKEPKDLDIMVEGGPGAGIEFAKLVAKEYNLHEPVVFKRFETARLFIDGEEIDFVIPRKEYYSEESRKPFVEPGDIEFDAKRRDFTINAIFLRLNDMQLLDLTGHGIRDLEEGIIRVTDPENADIIFSQDPLRILRAIRFAQKFGFDIDEKTKEAMKRNVERIKIISAERIQDELSKILTLPNPSKAIRLMDEIGLLPIILPELYATKGVTQETPYHSTDVFEHILRTLDLVPNDLVTRLAALLHDIGKPSTKQIIEGIAHFFGHEEVGAELAEAILRRLRFPNEVIEKVKFLIKEHMRPHMYKKEWTDSAIRRFINNFKDLLENALTLAEADAVSDYPGPKEEALGKYKELKERIEEVQKEKPVSEIKDLLSGFELMDMFGQEPGPWIKEIKDYLREKQFENPNLTKEEAKELAKEYYENKFSKKVKSVKSSWLASIIGEWFIKEAIQFNRFEGFDKEFDEVMNKLKTMEKKEEFEENRQLKQKIYWVLTTDPKTKYDKSYEEFEKEFTNPYPLNPNLKILSKKKILPIETDFGNILWKFYDELKNIENLKDLLLMVKKDSKATENLKKARTIEDVKAILGIGTERLEKEKKVKEAIELVAEDGDYKLVKANTPEAIKSIANSGFNTWCINSLSYARSYYESEKEGPGFFFVLYKNQPIYAIGGSDGISNILNVSLSRTPNYVIMDKEYEVLEKWKDVYKKPLLKPSRNNLITPELYQQHRSTILNKINNKEKLTNFEWQLLLTYLNDDKDIDKVKLLENVVTYPYSIARGDGDYIERAELAVFVAQAIVKDSYENIDLPEDLLKKLQNIISKDYYASVDYLIKVAKGYKEKYKPYREGIFDEFDPNDADDIEDLFKLLRLHGFELTEEEKQKFLENIGLIVIKTIKNNLGDLEYLLQKLNLSIDDVVSKISAHPTDSYEFARYLIENNKEVPDKIIDGISRDPNSSYDFAKYLIKNNKEVPDKIIDGISKDSEYSYYFAEDLIKNNKEVPDKIIDSLQKDKKQEILQLIQPNNQTVVQSWLKTTSVYEKYIQKRKFDKTPEPEPDITAETALLSYAIPKSKIPEKGEKLLAIETELHPIEYLIFEGIIPKGEYGGGQIKVYDKGKYRIVDANPKRMIIELEGGKVKGKFAIVHTKDKNYLFTRVQ